MKLTSKGRYAVIAMLYLALQRNTGSIRLAEISESQDISLSYLEQIFSKLKKANLVVSSRGPGGGYNLSREASHISVRDIVISVDESLDPRKCEGKQNCRKSGACLSHHLWEDLSLKIEAFLENVSLEDIINRKDTRQTISF